MKVGDLVRTILPLSQTGVVLQIGRGGLVETTFGMAHKSFLEVIA